MEYSLGQSLEGHSELYNIPFPELTSQPAIDHVSPGLGQIVNMFETIVPLRGQPRHSIEKKLELPNLDSTTESTGSDKILVQTGSGEAQIDPEILESFKHPIVTDSIIFPKQNAKKHKIEQVTDSKYEPPKKSKKSVNHRFQIV